MLIKIQKGVKSKICCATYTRAGPVLPHSVPPTNSVCLLIRYGKPTRVMPKNHIRTYRATEHSLKKLVNMKLHPSPFACIAHTMKKVACQGLITQLQEISQLTKENCSYLLFL